MPCELSPHHLARVGNELARQSFGMTVGLLVQSRRRNMSIGPADGGEEAGECRLVRLREIFIVERVTARAVGAKEVVPVGIVQLYRGKDAKSQVEVVGRLTACCAFNELAPTACLGGP